MKTLEININWKYLANKMTGSSARMIWVVLSIVSIMGVIDLPEATIFSQTRSIIWTGIIFISLFKGAVLTCLLVMSLPVKWCKIIMGTFTGIYIFFCVINFISFTLYGLGISHRLIIILVQTTPREIWEFMPTLFGNLISLRCVLMVMGGVAATGILCFCVCNIGKRLYLLILSTTSMIGVVALILSFGTFQQGRSPLIMSLRVPKYLINTIQENNAYQEIAASKRLLPYADKVESSNEPVTIIMIIGESAHRNHHQIYGYSLPTTPRLMALRDSLFIFKDAIGSSQSTAGNMERILSLKTDDTTCGDWYNFPLLYDIFNAAGFRTFWLSNQERRGIWSNASGVMAENAAVVKYVGAESSEDALRYVYDDVLIPHVRNALKDPASAKLIGIHLLGSHINYDNRYPKEEEFFTYSDVLKATPKSWLNKKKASMVAKYDNSIHFTDKLLGEIIRECSSPRQPVILLYFSDHGEMVYDTEDFKRRNEQCVEVPFIIYANQCYRRQYAEMLEKISHAQSLPISTANIPMALLTIAGIKYPLYDASNDFLSSKYRIRPRLVDEKIWKYEHVKKEI